MRRVCTPLRMKRRGFLAGAALLIAAPSMAQSTKPAQIGLLLQVPPSAAPVQPLWKALVDGLRAKGWEEGRNLVIETRVAGGDPTRFPALARELVTLNVDVILAANQQSIAAAQQATATIPIVMCGGADPVKPGFVASLAKPGGNITGITTDFETLIGKHYELLTEIKPGIKRVGVIYDPSHATSAALYRREQEEIAPRLGLALVPLPVSTAADIKAAFAAIGRERPDALQVQAIPIVQAHRAEIAAFAIEQRLPTMIGLKVLVPDGFLMSYAHDPAESFRRAAWYADRILRGAKPADLPVEQSSRFELVINLRTARAIGLEIPAVILARADELIE
jgi:putative tryptophan/tyrosine transport system substrate-binding protein